MNAMFASMKARGSVDGGFYILLRNSFDFERLADFFEQKTQLVFARAIAAIAPVTVVSGVFIKAGISRRKQ